MVSIHIFICRGNTKKDLIEILNIPDDKISVVYHGYSLKNDSTISQVDRIIEQPYILFIGSRDKYKNFNNLLKAYAISDSLSTDFQLVCFGNDRFTNNEIDEIERLNLRDRVIQLSGDDDVLANLYIHAAVFVYPSLYEGFGIPILEAMSFKCPVICSNTSSMPEVADSAAEYCYPDSVDSIVSAILNVVYSSERTKELIALGNERICKFSWDRCATQTSAIYSKLL